MMDTLEDGAHTVQTGDLMMVPALERVVVLLEAATGTPRRLIITADAHRDIAHRLQMPWRYYERMLETAPVLLARNVNYWWRTAPEEREVVVAGGRLVEWVPVGTVAARALPPACDGLLA